MTALFTIGHGTLRVPTFAAHLNQAGMRHLVDVRSTPGSRRHPRFGRSAVHGDCVKHILGDARLEAHRVTERAEKRGGVVIYPPREDALL